MVRNRDGKETWVAKRKGPGRPRVNTTGDRVALQLHGEYGPVIDELMDRLNTKLAPARLSYRYEVVQYALDRLLSQFRSEDKPKRG